MACHLPSQVSLQKHVIFTIKAEPQQVSSEHLPAKPCRHARHDHACLMCIVRGWYMCSKRGTHSKYLKTSHSACWAWSISCQSGSGGELPRSEVLGVAAAYGNDMKIHMVSRRNISKQRQRYENPYCIKTQYLKATMILETLLKQARIEDEWFSGV